MKTAILILLVLVLIILGIVSVAFFYFKPFLSVSETNRNGESNVNVLMPGISVQKSGQNNANVNIGPLHVMVNDGNVQLENSAGSTTEVIQGSNSGGSVRVQQQY